MQHKIESCYDEGDLVKALEQAAQFIQRIGERSVTHVIALKDEVLDGWYVDVIYETTER